MKILLFRSNNIFDSRVNKYRNYYLRVKLSHTIVGWDREGNGISREGYDFYRFKAGEAVGGIKAVVNHFKWMVFVFRYLMKNKDVTTIHACDLNSAFPAAIYKFFFKKDVALIFDACDWFSSNFAHRRFLKKAFEVMEKITYKLSDYLIICEPEREEQIQFRLKHPPYILPNIPEIDSSSIENNKEEYQFNNSYPTIAYLGGFSDNRFLAELITLTKTEHFNLLIAGYGEPSIVHACKEVANLDNVKYMGRLPMSEGLNMESSADIIYAMYCKTNPNNIYAAPNKFYEALLLGKPIITTKGTIVEPKVINNNIGWTIEESIEDLRDLIRSLKLEEIKEKGNNALTLWNIHFKDYVRNFFDNTYCKLIK